MPWDAEQYLKFSRERSRPFFDLIEQVPEGHLHFVADLGCGPGLLTRALAERWPQATVVGIDSSPEMLAKARSQAIPGRLSFQQADIATWRPSQPLDLIVSNAALQWVPDHHRLLGTLATDLAPKGTLAVQMPCVSARSPHHVIEETIHQARWARLQGVSLHANSMQPLSWYVERLLELGFAVNAWETTYWHILTGDDPLVEWFKGSALRPCLELLEPADTQAFLADLAARYRALYPPTAGRTLVPFTRLFFVATRRET